MLLCFFLSGFAALLYQTAWIREFSFVFGTSSIAVAAVLAAYMSGLAAGAALAGRFLMRVKRPILVYGLLEGGVAVSAIAVPYLIRAATALCRRVLGGHATLPDEGGTALLLFFFAASFLILMIPTLLMGATLPLLTRSAVQRDDQVGPRTGLLYGLNTTGAVLGTIAAAFWLLPALGLRSTVYVGVAVNVLVFIVAARLSRGEALPDPSRAPSTSTATSPSTSTDAGAGTKLALAMLTLALASGIASFTYEVLWTRLLAHILGGSVYAFATMLATFLSGIALGSAVASRLARKREHAARYFAFAQLGIALSSAATFALLDALPGWAASVGAGGGTRHTANALIAAAILLPSATFIGATFPFVVRFVAPDGDAAGLATARTYAWNTGGAILGAVGAAFVLIPQLGYRGTLSVTVAINVTLAVIAGLALARVRRSEGVLLVAAGVAVVVASFFLSPPWRLLVTSPLTIGGETPQRQIRYYGVGRSASVLALQEAGAIRLFANGLPESVIRPPGVPSPPGGMWLATLPAMVRPDVEDMLVIGLGAGAALETVPSTVQAIEVVELEPEVVVANRVVSALRARDPLADPRVQIRVNDARGAMILTDARYDAIVSQPSHPWTAGASHLYTRDFFEQAATHLTENGVFLQWIGLVWIDEALFRTLLATLKDVFPHVHVFIPYPHEEAFFVATKAPLDWRAGARSLVQKVPAECRSLGLGGPEDLLLELAFDEAAVRALAHAAPVSRDDLNLLQTRSPALLGKPQKLEWVRTLQDEYGSRARHLDGMNTGYLTRRLLDRGDRAGAQVVLAAEQDPTQRAITSAWLAGGTRPGFAPESAAQLVTALRADLSSEAAQVAWMQNALPLHARGQAAPADLLAALTGRVRSLRDASLAMARSDWLTAATHDQTLAQFAALEPGHKTAQRLRAAWRLESRDPERCREAAALLDDLHEPGLSDLVGRAQALLYAGAHDAALNAAGAVLRHMANQGKRTLTRPEVTLVRQLQQVIAQIPETPARGMSFAAARETLAFLLGSHK